MSAHITPSQAADMDDTADFAQDYVPEPVTWPPRRCTPLDERASLRQAIAGIYGCAGDCEQGRKPCTCGASLNQYEGLFMIDGKVCTPVPAEAAGAFDDDDHHHKQRLGAIGPVHRFILRRCPTYTFPVMVLLAVACFVRWVW